MYKQQFMKTQNELVNSVKQDKLGFCYPGLNISGVGAGSYLRQCSTSLNYFHLAYNL